SGATRSLTERSTGGILGGSGGRLSRSRKRGEVGAGPHGTRGSWHDTWQMGRGGLPPGGRDRLLHLPGGASEDLHGRGTNPLRIRRPRASADGRPAHLRDRPESRGGERRGGPEIHLPAGP